MLNKRSRKSEFNKPTTFLQIALVVALCFVSAYSQAQCAMCRAAIESEGSAAKAEAVNDGIVYLMAFPYILVAVICYFIYKTGKKLKK